MSLSSPSLPFPRHLPPFTIPDLSYTRDQLHRLLSSVRQRPVLPVHKLDIYSIGCGNIVQVSHWPSYRQAGFEVKGVFDVDLSTAREMASKWSIERVFSSLDEMVEVTRHKRVLYDVAVPASALLDVLSRLPDNSFALIQKPMGDSLEEAAAIVKMCERKNIAAAVNFQLIYTSYVMAMKELIERGVIGDIVGIEFHVDVNTPWHRWPFLEKTKHMEPAYHSIHYLSALRYLYGDPYGMHAMTWKHPDLPKLASTRSDYIFMYSDDVAATIHTNHNNKWGGFKHAQSYIKIEGRKGMLKACMGMNIDYPTSDLDYLDVATEATGDETLSVKLEGSWCPDAFKGPAAAVMAFAEGSIPSMPTSVQDSYKTMVLVETLYESAKHPTVISYDMI